MMQVIQGGPLLKGTLGVLCLVASCRGCGSCCSRQMRNMFTHKRMTGGSWGLFAITKVGSGVCYQMGKSMAGIGSRNQGTMWWYVDFMGRGATTHRREKNGGTTPHGGNPNKLTEARFINVGANAHLRGVGVRGHFVKRLGG